nr:hypothetical protein CFP56_24023 [Quercus suber]
MLQSTASGDSIFSKDLDLDWRGGTQISWLGAISYCVPKTTRQIQLLVNTRSSDQASPLEEVPKTGSALFPMGGSYPRPKHRSTMAIIETQASRIPFTPTLREATSNHHFS